MKSKLDEGWETQVRLGRFRLRRLLIALQESVACCSLLISGVDRNRTGAAKINVITMTGRAVVAAATRAMATAADFAG